MMNGRQLTRAALWFAAAACLSGGGDVAHAQSTVANWRLTGEAGAINAYLCRSEGDGRCLILRCSGDAPSLSITGMTAFVTDRPRQGRVTVGGASWFSWFIPDIVRAGSFAWTVSSSEGDAERVLTALRDARAIRIDIGDGDQDVGFSLPPAGDVVDLVAGRCRDASRRASRLP